MVTFAWILCHKNKDLNLVVCIDKLQKGGFGLPCGPNGLAEQESKFSSKLSKTDKMMMMMIIGKPLSKIQIT